MIVAEDKEGASETFADEQLSFTNKKQIQEGIDKNVEGGVKGNVVA